ncbi:MAG TPA: patatin-like phospholipase family protein [Candidatus Sulfotelmatobacter sp.]|nr:patatin-like phospholipase family protein [Candidatus Sulfotelmatobacter sp.]
MRLSLFALFTLCFAYTCLAQETPPPPPTASSVEAKPSLSPRLKIGVALEGGGALGEAHVGVLKWFEEHHIPIDYLAGTSMGGLVGGFYATGKSADDLQQILLTANWPLLLGGGTPYEDLSFRRKEDARTVPNSVQVGLKHGATLPPGLNTGHQINLLIDRDTIDFSNIHSFDDLPIPFRCVSTELISGKSYVFQSGSLSDAMRATISIPGVFAPVRQGDKIFVDGGLVDNLPTDVVRNMGADVVIAVHLQLSPATAKDIQGAFSVLGRSVALVIAETEIRGMAGADLIVNANVAEFSSTDYQKTEQLIQRGYDSAQEKAQILKAYSLDDAAWAEYLQQKKSRMRPAPGVPEFVRVEGVDSEGKKNIEHLLRNFVGKPLETKSLDQVLTRLTGIGRYDSITYSVINDGNQNGLSIRVHEKTYAPPFLLPFVEINGSEPQDVDFTMGARITAMDVLGYRSEWRTDLHFGATYGIASELYRPFQPLGKWFFAPYVDASQTNFKVYKNSDPRAIYRLDNVLTGVDLGYSLSRFNEIRVGYGVGYQDYALRLGTPDFPSTNGRVGSFHARYILDHTNEAVIPTRGVYLKTSFEWFDTTPISSTAYPSLELLVQYFQPVSSAGSLFFTANGASTFGHSSPGAPIYFLGGVGRLSAYGLNELIGNQYFLGRTGYLHKVFTLPQFVGKQVYVTGFAEVGKMYGDPFGAPKLSGDFAGGVLAETFFGPILIGGSIGDTGHQKWFFQLGRVF